MSPEGGRKVRVLSRRAGEVQRPRLSNTEGVRQSESDPSSPGLRPPPCPRPDGEGAITCDFGQVDLTSAPPRQLTGGPSPRPAPESPSLTLRLLPVPRTPLLIVFRLASTSSLRPRHLHSWTSTRTGETPYHGSRPPSLCGQISLPLPDPVNTRLRRYLRPPWSRPGRHIKITVNDYHQRASTPRSPLLYPGGPVSLLPSFRGNLLPGSRVPDVPQPGKGWVSTRHG